MKYSSRSRVWVYPGSASWYFVTLNRKVAKDIKETFGVSDHGFGSFPVKVKIGATSWGTSIFPDKKSGSFVLPLKASVRKKEKIKEGSLVSYAITVQP